jgi:hypothetical protein
MPGPNFILDKGFIMDSAVSQFQVVKLAATKEHATISTAAGEDVLGVVQQSVAAADATNGQVADVRLMGISRCIAAATLAIGDYVRSNGDGRVTSLVGATAKQNIIGRCMTAAGAANDHVDVLLLLGTQRDT